MYQILCYFRLTHNSLFLILSTEKQVLIKKNPTKTKLLTFEETLYAA